jgi:DNA-directed RNA polymerase subunit RPC12/RpoP|tara:strand:- start:108 stop:416 length:309 start_codon:yes stop_codon:yes gene_type:complete
MKQARIYRCQRCGKGLDADVLGHDPLSNCPDCGHRRFEENQANLKPAEQLGLYTKFGIWFCNTDDQHWLDKEIMRVGAMPPGRAQDKQESLLLTKVREGCND